MLDKNVTFADHEIELPDGSKVKVSDLPEHAKVYWFDYGFTQSLADSYAQARSKAKADGKTEAEIEALETEKMTERYQKVIDGTMGVRAGGPRASKRDSVIKAVTIEKLREAIAKANRKAPKVGSDEWNKLVETFGQINAKVIETEADRRMAEVLEDVVLPS